MPNAVANGVRLHYVQVGGRDGDDREHLVMLHGLAANLAFWYFHYAHEFANRFRVTLIDLRGHGGSGMPPDGYAPANIAQDVHELLASLGIERAHFLAHSFGGVVALHHACRHPGTVRSLVLADCHIPGLRGPASPWIWVHGQVISPVLERHGIDLDIHDPQFGYHLLGQIARWRLESDAIPEDLMRFIGPVMARLSRRTAAQWLELIETTSAERDILGAGPLSAASLQTMDFPRLAIYGDASHARGTGEKLCEIWPNGEFCLIRQAGHFFPLSRRDEVVTECSRFWNELGDAGNKGRRPHDQRNYFHTHRVFAIDGAWYCAVREGGPLGPFESRDEASDQLANAIASGGE